LPAAGGALGGIVGGIGGSVLGVGVGGVPGAIGGATLGGGAGEAARQLLNRARGVDAPATSTDAAMSIGKEGLIQGALETGGAAIAGIGRAAGRSLLENAVRPTPSLKAEFPNVMHVIEQERLPVGKGPFGGPSGAAQATLKRQTASKALRELLTKAEASGTQFTNDQVAGPVLDLVDKIAKQPLGDAEERQLGDMLNEFLKRHPGPLTPTAVKDLKASAQSIAAPIFKAAEKGFPVDANQTLKARFNGAIADGAKTSLETIDGAGAAEAKTQGLIGATRALKAAEGRRLPLSAEAISAASPVITALLSHGSSLPMEVQKGAIAYLTTRGLMSPRSGSRIALALTKKETTQLLNQFPRLGDAVVTALQGAEAGSPTPETPPQ
jgi:hypothetical protein